ncbi:hypothetical protein [Rhizobium sp. RU36D]|uniref:ribbon-helix-helix domain-containing protein n=1 Tax=Rhizobium sp. RU36D TaxID=1907415 RepID=UPI0009D845BE|nr:hypothetical protein [Rhizobium sp. RU36D]SMC91396.1 hypothetical protein SAMN05880593_11053 [Rhizobium sp. RU36D]
MTTERLHIDLDSSLAADVRRRVSQNARYRDTSDYLEDLIRRDLQNRDADLRWLQEKLEPGMRSDDSAFVTVTAKDVIERNKHR